MDTLLNPDTGLAIWTIVTFLALVFLLKRFAWGPLLAALEQREAVLRQEREQAEQSRREAERIQQEIHKRLNGLSSEAQEILGKAHKEGEALREKIKSQAEEEARRLIEKARAQLEEDKRRLMAELRNHVTELSALAAERLMRKSVDAQVRKTVMEQFFRDLDSKHAAL